MAELTRSDPATAEQRAEVLQELLELHTSVADDPDAAEEVRRAVLRVIEGAPSALEEERVARFLADHVEPEDFAWLPWQSTDRLVRL